MFWDSVGLVNDDSSEVQSLKIVTHDTLTAATNN